MSPVEWQFAPRRSGKGKATLQVKERARKHKAERLTVAAQWCRDNNKGVDAAISKGFIPKELRSSLSRIIYGESNPGGHSKKHVLTQAEEDELVEYINKYSELGFATSRAILSNWIVEILRFRVAANKDGGRKAVPLSTNAETVLQVSYFYLFYV